MAATAAVLDKLGHEDEVVVASQIINANVVTSNTATTVTHDSVEQSLASGAEESVGIMLHSTTIAVWIRHVGKIRVDIANWSFERIKLGIVRVNGGGALMKIDGTAVGKRALGCEGTRVRRMVPGHEGTRDGAGDTGIS